LAKAQLLHTEAEKKLSKLEKGRVFKIGNKSSKYEDIAELFSKAAKLYQLAKSYRNAGDTFSQAAVCYNAGQYGKYNAAMSYVHSSQCYVKEDVTAAIMTLLKGIAILTEEGKFTIAAKYESDIGDMFAQISDIDNAIKHYELAYDFYESEGSIQTGCSCFVKAAYLAADKGDYRKAIEIFETVSDATCTGVTKHLVKEHYLKAGILYLREGDVVAAQRAVERWVGKVPEFCGTREHKFLVQLVDAVKELDLEGFKTAVAEWDEISTLDSWKRGLLVKIMETLEENGEDLT